MLSDVHRIVERRRHRAQTYRAPTPPSFSSASPSPPPRNRRHRSPIEHPQRRAPDPRDPRDPHDEYFAPRRRRAREEDYYSDNRHNRPRRDAYHGRPRQSRYREPPRDYQPPRDHHERRERPRDDERRLERPRPERRGSKWQREAKDMFVEYAVPVIKAEGGKYLSKQIGNFIAKKA